MRALFSVCYNLKLTFKFPLKPYSTVGKTKEFMEHRFNFQKKVTTIVASQLMISLKLGRAYRIDSG